MHISRKHIYVDVMETGGDILTRNLLLILQVAFAFLIIPVGKEAKRLDDRKDLDILVILGSLNITN